MRDKQIRGAAGSRFATLKLARSRFEQEQKQQQPKNKKRHPICFKSCPEPTTVEMMEFDEKCGITGEASQEPMAESESPADEESSRSDGAAGDGISARASDLSVAGEEIRLMTGAEAPSGASVRLVRLSSPAGGVDLRLRN